LTSVAYNRDSGENEVPTRDQAKYQHRGTKGNTGRKKRTGKKLNAGPRGTWSAPE